MKTYILGAGASAHAGYALASALAIELDRWALSRPDGDDIKNSIASVKEIYGSLDDFEAVLTQIDTDLRYLKSTEPNVLTDDEITRRVVLSHARTNLGRGICFLFDSLRERPAVGYEHFAMRCINPGDCVISFNYDVSLERELRKAGKWDIGDGYGFPVCPERIVPSPVKVLKLHGSTNWSAVLFDGAKGSGYASSSPLGEQPIILPHEFRFFGYESPTDQNILDAASLTTLIMPGRRKTFHYETSFGPAWVEFWEALWQVAKEALHNSTEIYLFGYSLPSADEQARALLFEHTNKEARIAISCRSPSQRIQNEFVENGFRFAICEPLDFEEWATSI